MKRAPASGPRFQLGLRIGSVRHWTQGCGERPASYIHFCADLSYLQSVGLVTVLATPVDRANPNRLILTMDTATAERIARMRFGA